MTVPDNNCICVFVKYPQAGKVKTRLGPEIGFDNAAELYKRFVADELAVAKSIDAETVICFEPEQKREQYTDWLGNDLSYIRQRGSDIGQRMQNAFEDCFKQGFGQVVLIGSDIPDIRAYILKDSFARLTDGSDMVIGPSSDGGYYLIGFSKNSFEPGIFQDVTWSTQDVFEQTMLNIEEFDISVSMVERWHDIDNLSDVNNLIKRSQGKPFTNSATMEFIQKNCLTP